MRKHKGLYAGVFVLGLSVVSMFGTSVAAEEYYDDGYYEEEYYEDDGYYEEEVAEPVALDGDNSLSRLGLNDAYHCSPDFQYDRLEYNVTVPAGTTKFDFDPVKSSSKADITSIEGTSLDANGNGTVEVTVKAENGATVTYYLHVTADAPAVAAETEAPKEETEKVQKETEKAKASKKEKAALAAAESEKAALQSEKDELAQKLAQVQQKENQVSLLQNENDDLAYRLDLLMKVLYGLIGFAVILLFFIINQSLRNKDLKDDIKKAKADLEEANATPATTDFYYAPVQQPAQADEPVFVPADDSTPVLSKKELKKLEKEAKKAAKEEAKQARAKKKYPEESIPVAVIPPAIPKVEQEPVVVPEPIEVPVQEAPAVEPIPEVINVVKEATPVSTPAETVNVEPQLVKGSVNEPDVKVDMIEL